MSRTTTAAHLWISGGCDGAVVPTLVDWATGEVIVDSRRICLHLDAAATPPRPLRPGTLADAIDAQLAVVDHLPNYQMLMGRLANVAEGVTRQDAAASLSRRKVAWCDRYLAEHRDDTDLIAAYAAKRSKELSAATGLFSPEAMRTAYERAEAALVGLEALLASRPGHWLHGDAPMMSDLFWGVELLRMRNVGVAHYWEQGRMPGVASFLAAAERLEAIRAAVTEWPGAEF